ncbi:LacI family DNA-binding transcriptional regulator [Kineococcus xinjiangensis]|uniref:LacI family DNA-binding transcriptional regulator n=1 Tax=Kineococcus xinjiangensis TaxID=512762 RepID=UPI001B80B455|nr:LacI family DNA-binding transcriptional regulator [Kineococcus xinjiangensis]
MTARRASTLTEVAARAGVSLTTASKAINGQSRVSEETRARVLKAARELSFTPNPMARSLISGRSGTVGLVIVDSLSQRFVVPTMLGAEAALSEIDLTMITSDARGDAGRLKAILDMLRQRKVDGILVLGDDNAVTPSLSADIDVPVVYVHGETTQPRDIAHVPDDRYGGHLLAEHLLDTGRRRIAHVSGPAGTRAVTERAAGVQSALGSAGLELAAPIAYGPWSQRWGRQAVERLLTEVPDVDAIVCGSDQIAYGVVTGLQAAGRGVPDDVAVTGYDNWAPFALETDPPLTTVDMNLEDLGAAAVRDLFGIIDGERVGHGVRLHDCTLVVRESTGPAATGR